MVSFDFYSIARIATCLPSHRIDHTSSVLSIDLCKLGTENLPHTFGNRHNTNLWDCVIFLHFESIRVNEQKDMDQWACRYSRNLVLQDNLCLVDQHWCYKTCKGNILVNRHCQTLFSTRDPTVHNDVATILDVVPCHHFYWCQLKLLVEKQNPTSKHRNPKVLACHRKTIHHWL